eukprot:scaffold248400_cov37-Cyclotella_meneghiniana.AAC.5
MTKKFWCPAGARDEVTMCRALALPTEAAIEAITREMTPHELTEWTNGKVADEESPITEDDVDNMFNWSVGAGQVETGNNKTPSVALEVKMAMTQNPDFLRWCDYTLDAKLGPRPDNNKEAALGGNTARATGQQGGGYNLPPELTQECTRFQ